MFLGMTNGEKGDSEEGTWEKKFSMVLGKDRIKAIQDHIKWQCPREKDRTMVAYRANRSLNGT